MEINAIIQEFFSYYLVSAFVIGSIPATEELISVKEKKNQQFICRKNIS